MDPIGVIYAINSKISTFRACMRTKTGTVTARAPKISCGSSVHWSARSQQKISYIFVVAGIVLITQTQQTTAVHILIESYPLADNSLLSDTYH